MAATLSFNQRELNHARNIPRPVVSCVFRERSFLSKSVRFARVGGGGEWTGGWGEKDEFNFLENPDE